MGIADAARRLAPLVPFGLVAAGAAVPLIGGGFGSLGYALIWLGAAAAVAIGRAIVRFPPSTLGFIDLVLAALLAFLWFEGGLWLLPAVAAQWRLDRRAAAAMESGAAG